jgi:ATP-dependent protease HslVU (ClpYQ) peptidase subunit
MPSSQSGKVAGNIIGLRDVDPMFARIRVEAEEIVRREPEVAGFVLGTILNHDRLESAIIHRLADRLDHQEVPGDLIRQTFLDVISRDPSIIEAFRFDMMAVADRDVSLILSGTGDVLEPEDGLIGIGSGGAFALAAARALADLPDMDADAIARKAMKIAADICIYTNNQLVVETL